MALVNVEEREKLQVKKLLAQIKKEIKESFPNHGEIEHFKDGNGEHTITVENGLGWVTATGFGGFSGVMRDIVKDSEFAKFKDYGEKAGHYMWDAKVYIKDYSWVTFTI